MKKKSSGKKKICVQGVECKGACISRLKKCRPIVDTATVKKAVAKIKSASDRLSRSKPKNVEARLSQKRGIKRIQYVSQDEVLRALVVYRQDVTAIKAGKATHPYITMRRPNKDAVEKLHDKIKKENPALYQKLSGLGLRKDKEGNTPSTSEKVKLAIEVYLQQDGKSFATGKKVSINLMSLDHLVPISAGGKNEAANLVLIESNINYLKGARTLKGFRSTLEKKAALAHSPEALKDFKDTIKKGDAADIEKAQKELQKGHRIARIGSDVKQAQRAVQGARSKAADLEKYGAVNELGVRAYARYDNPEIINALKAKDLKSITKAQAANGDGVARWYRSPNINGSQVDYPTGDALKAQVFLNNGGKWREMPGAWKDALKSKYENNAHAAGNKKLAEAYKKIEDKPEWLK